MVDTSRRVETHTKRAIQEVKRKHKRSLKREKKDYAFGIKMGQAKIDKAGNNKC